MWISNNLERCEKGIYTEVGVILFRFRNHLEPRKDTATLKPLQSRDTGKGARSRSRDTE
jgi:hypothetical protein